MIYDTRNISARVTFQTIKHLLSHLTVVIILTIESRMVHVHVLVIYSDSLLV